MVRRADDAEFEVVEVWGLFLYEAAKPVWG